MLVCVGDVLEEVLVRLEADPVRGGDLAVRSARGRGGAAANVAALAAELGTPTCFVGQVGADPVGEFLCQDLERRGVSLAVRRVGPSGIIVTMLGRGGRSRLIDRGTAARLSTIDPAVLDDASHVFVPAACFTEDPTADAVDRLLGEARDRRLSVTVGGPGTADLESLGSDAFLGLCAALEPAHVVLDLDEHARLGLPPRAPVPGATHTVVTNASRPALVIDADGDTDAVEVRPVGEVRDRTGVGDGFIAGFLTARLRGADPVAAVHAGHRAAAEVLAQVGPTTGRTA